MPESMNIAPPMFKQYEHVWAMFQGNLIPSTVVKRFYDPDCGCWYYKLSEGNYIFIQDDLGPRILDSELSQDKVIEPDNGQTL